MAFLKREIVQLLQQHFYELHYEMIHISQQALDLFLSSFLMMLFHYRR